MVAMATYMYMRADWSTEFLNYYYYLIYHPIAELVQVLISRMGESKYKWGNVGKGVKKYQHKGAG